jgi:hypothetical protein
MTAARSILGGNARTMPTISARPTCAVRLIDRRTGSVHRVNGTPLVVFTRNPDEAVADLLQGRDGRLWEARIDRLGGGAK